MKRRGTGSIVVTFGDDRIYAGNTSAEVVRRIADDGVFTCGESNPDYMEGVRRRVANLSKENITFSNEAEFLEELARIKEITLLRMS